MGRPWTVAAALVRMSRPDQLLLIVVVALLGAAIAAAHGTTADAATLAVGLAALLPVAASVHYANEYADHETDALTEQTRFSGGSGALPETGLSPRVALRAAKGTAVLGGTVTAAAVAAGRLPAVAATLLAVIAVLGWAYSVGPALAWRGLGELDNAALGGLVLPLYGYAVASGTVTVAAALACLPFAIVVFANLLATQWPDRKADQAVGKETLAVRWSARRLRLLYLGTVGAAAVVGLALWAVGVLPTLVAAASLPVVPLLAWGASWFTRRRSPFPTVAAMVALVVLQAAAWSRVAGLV